MRVDKFLWAVRLFKTRSIATEACKSGRILINDITVKPSRELKVGEIFVHSKEGILFRYKVLAELEKRVGAKLVPDYLEDITPDDEIEKLEIKKYTNSLQREKGTGRPTKKDRRDIDKLLW